MKGAILEVDKSFNVIITNQSVASAPVALKLRNLIPGSTDHRPFFDQLPRP